MGEHVWDELETSDNGNSLDSMRMTLATTPSKGNMEQNCLSPELDKTSNGETGTGIQPEKLRPTIYPAYKIFRSKGRANQ